MTLRRSAALSPWLQLTIRLAVLTALLVFIVAVHWFEREALKDNHDGHVSFSDVIYFTMVSITTTGYGDILLPGRWGRVLSIITMVAGITLFVRLAQALFRPHKVRFRCPRCGLGVHDPDAVHCKACGHVLNIPDPGN